MLVIHLLYAWTNFTDNFLISSLIHLLKSFIHEVIFEYLLCVMY